MPIASPDSTHRFLSLGLGMLRGSPGVRQRVCVSALAQTKWRCRGPRQTGIRRVSQGPDTSSVSKPAANLRTAQLPFQPNDSGTGNAAISCTDGGEPKLFAWGGRPDLPAIKMAGRPRMSQSESVSFVRSRFLSESHFACALVDTGQDLTRESSVIGALRPILMI